MKGKAIVKIVICSVLAVIFTAIFAGALLISFSDFFEEDLSIELPEIGWEDHNFLVGGAEISQNVNKLEIDWAAGQIILRAYDGDTLRFSEGLVSKMGDYVPGTEDIPAEYAPIDEDALRYKVTNGTLTIQSEKSSLKFWGINSIKPKVLLVLIPQGALDSVDIDNASSLVTLEGLTLDSAQLDTASGDLLVENCKVTKLDVDSASGDCEVIGQVKTFDFDTASGDGKLQGSVEAVDMDSASGDLILNCDNTPRKIDFDSASGYADISLPGSSEFSAELDADSGDLSVSGFAVQMQNDKCIVGSGAANYDFDTASGDVTIRANETE